MEKKTIQHLNPIWRDKTNFILRARIYDSVTKEPKGWEQLWGRKLTDNTYEICCIPFFLYDLSLGDIIKYERGSGVLVVIKPSGHFTFRVWFGDSKNPYIREEVMKKVEDLECLFEWYSNNLLGIDASSEVTQQIADYLYDKQQLGVLVYETSKT